MQEVQIRPVPLEKLAELLTADRAALLAEYQVLGAKALQGRIVWNVNSTARGGGVAEMLQGLVAYALGAGVDTRWVVIEGNQPFFAVTKRLHNRLHGVAGDDGDLGDDARAVYSAVQEWNLHELVQRVRPGDLVLLHDPQTAGLVAGIQRAGAHVVWRCHIGRDEQNDFTRQAWSFLEDFVTPAQGFVFSRHQFAPTWVPDARLRVIPPSLDPFSSKNAEMSPADVAATLTRVGIVGGEAGRAVVAGGPVPLGARVVLQVSRWDRLKDMAGVLTGFVEHLPHLPADVHLVLAGPENSGVADDPEADEVLAECLALWHGLSEADRQRVHLCCLPMANLDENARLVNALQRHATVVVQKSLEEGFGLTVTEPMWKGRPVVASAVGGIQDQIVDGVSGLLLSDPRDHAELAAALRSVLADGDRGAALGAGAHSRVRDQFLADRHLIQYVDLFRVVLSEDA